MNIYVAASFAYEDKAKTEIRKHKIEEVVEKIKKHLSGDYYLPHKLKIENAWDISLEEWCEKVYQRDLNALMNADVILFLSFGKENNAGAVWEIGWAEGKNMSLDPLSVMSRVNVICIKMTDDVESLMVSQSVHAMLKEDEIDSYDWKNLPRYRTELKKLS